MKTLPPLFQSSSSSPRLPREHFAVTVFYRFLFLHFNRFEFVIFNWLFEYERRFVVFQEGRSKKSMEGLALAESKVTMLILGVILGAPIYSFYYTYT